MSSIAINGPSYLSFWTRTDKTGNSDEAIKLKGFIDDTVQALRLANTWNKSGDLFDSLKELYDECSNDNWDGYGAMPIYAGAFNEAINLLNSLPKDIPLPELVPEPDGSIGFEWENGKNRVFAISVTGKGKITYAGLLGKGIKAHGTEIFDDSIPKRIIECIKQIFY